jgi:precorrin-6Y C5,15-methyltransferase (decarboxylating)
MYKICIFAGTTEGRELVKFLSSQPVEVTACVATEYGETMLPEADNLTISAGRLPVDEITKMLSGSAFDLVIDATHPYAASITGSIAKACRATGTESLRLLRGASSLPSDAVVVPDAEAAAAFLDQTEGNILLTTGSKDLPKFSGMNGFCDRVYARVLPMEASLAACNETGLKASHIIAMQGPFSEEMNLALIHAVSAAYLVTKDGGKPGGFDAKISAAKKTGVKLVVIGRPAAEDGVTFEETIRILCDRFGCTYRPHVDVVGIGPGSRETMTEEVHQLIARADCLIGAKRMLEAAAAPGQEIHDAIAPGAIAEFIRNHCEYQRFAVVMSGDAGFFSGTKKLLPLLDFCQAEVHPGVSSLSYLCARLKRSYEDVFMTSLHGRDHNIVPDVRAHEKVFALVGGESGVRDLCRSLTAAGLGDVRVSVGERLSYPEEKITCDTAEHLSEEKFESLSAVLIENDHPDAIVTHGLPDKLFQRGAGEGGAVPMTKSEVRAVCLSKLRLTERAVCWDVGAGTGSVAIEMAIQAKKGHVYAIERRDAAIELLRRNKEKFSAENLSVISGSAPEACEELPAPTHVFIGGSSGNLREILSLLLEKNPEVRVVATAITLESIAELTACMKDFPFSETEVVSMQVARDRVAGNYHLMTGQNPIYIFTMQAGGDQQ